VLPAFTSAAYVYYTVSLGPCSCHVLLHHMGSTVLDCIVSLVRPYLPLYCSAFGRRYDPVTLACLSTASCTCRHILPAAWRACGDLLYLPAACHHARDSLDPDACLPPEHLRNSFARHTTCRCTRLVPGFTFGLALPAALQLTAMVPATPVHTYRYHTWTLTVCEMPFTAHQPTSHCPLPLPYTADFEHIAFTCGTTYTPVGGGRLRRRRNQTPISSLNHLPIPVLW